MQERAWMEPMTFNIMGLSSTHLVRTLDLNSTNSFQDRGSDRRVDQPKFNWRKINWNPIQAIYGHDLMVYWHRTTCKDAKTIVWWFLVAPSLCCLWKNIRCQSWVVERSKAFLQVMKTLRLSIHLCIKECLMSWVFLSKRWSEIIEHIIQRLFLIFVLVFRSVTN